MDVFESMAISVILLSLKTAIKNPAKAEALKAALLKIKAQIELLYPGE